MKQRFDLTPQDQRHKLRVLAFRSQREGTVESRLTFCVPADGDRFPAHYD